MTHTQLIYFVAVAEQLNLTRVSEQFHVSQPAVSSAIRDLEKEFQVILFERRRNELVLTPRGDHVYRRAKALLRHYEEFYSSIPGDFVPKNSCSVAFAPNVAAIHLCDLHLYAKENEPEFTITFQEESIANMTHMLKNSLLDAAIFACYPDDIDQTLSYVTIGKMTLSVCAHPNIFYSKRTVTPISALKDIPIVLQQHGSVQNTTVRALFHKEGIRPNVIYESSQNSTMHDIVCKGIAAGCLMPAVLFQNDESIRIYQLEGETPLPIHFVYKEKTSDVATFLRLVKAYFKQRRTL